MPSRRRDHTIGCGQRTSVRAHKHELNGRCILGQNLTCEGKGAIWKRRPKCFSVLLSLEELLYADTNRLDNTLKHFGRRFQMGPFPSQVRFWPRMQRPLSLCLWARTLVRWPHPLV